MKLTKTIMFIVFALLISCSDENPTEPENLAPRIERLQASPSGIKTGGITNIYCVATDQDGDDLTLSWSASKGSFPSGTSGDTVQWQAPDQVGSYAISLIVSDGKKTARAQLSVVVYETGTVTDIDGYVYKTVKIGGQWWMAENLKVTRYRNGDSIPNATDNSQWKDLITDARCAYNNDNGHIATYGLLYNWNAVNDPRGLAPAGWHVPTDEEWKMLEDYLGGSSVAGGKMKSTGTIEGGDGLWHSPNVGLTNESGFSALPGGCRSAYGEFYFEGYGAYFWSSTEGTSYGAWIRYLRYGNSDIGRYGYGKLCGFAVRCVRD